MNVKRAKKVHLDPEAGAVEYEPADWSRTGPRLMRHALTHTTFSVAPDGAAIKRGVIGLFDVAAQLVHVCDGHDVPSPDEQVELGRAAVAVYLQEIGAWRPENVQHVHAPPKLMQ